MTRVWAGVLLAFLPSASVSQAADPPIVRAAAAADGAAVRVSTLMIARELSGAVFPEASIRDPFHTLSHHSNDRGNMDRFAQPNTYHMTKLASFVEKLKGTADGDGTRLDHALVLYGSSLSDGNQHRFSPLPIVLAGGASGKVKGGRHLVFPKDTHMSNLLVAMLNTLDARVETFGDSTGSVSL